MSRIILTLAACVALSGCVSMPKLPSFHLGAKTPAAPSQAVASTRSCTADMSADVEPMPPIPAGATVPAAQMADESKGFQLYLSWLHDLASWGKDLADRAQDTKDWCAGK